MMMKDLTIIKQILAGIEINFHDKSGNLEKLCKHLGIYKDNAEITVKHTLADLVVGSYQKTDDGTK